MPLVPAENMRFQRHVENDPRHVPCNSPADAAITGNHQNTLASDLMSGGAALARALHMSPFCIMFMWLPGSVKRSPHSRDELAC
jgi:hypothetical protein